MAFRFLLRTGGDPHIRPGTRVHSLADYHWKGPLGATCEVLQQCCRLRGLGARAHTPTLQISRESLEKESARPFGAGLVGNEGFDNVIRTEVCICKAENACHALSGRHLPESF